MLSVFSNIFDLNQSVLPGAMDIIAVKQKDGTIKSTPFHVRFGEIKITKKKEKTINLFVNDFKIPVEMILASSGDAYFGYDDEIESLSQSHYAIETDSVYSEETTFNKKSDKEITLLNHVSNFKQNLFDHDEVSIGSERYRSNSAPSFNISKTSYLDSIDEAKTKIRKVKIKNLSIHELRPLPKKTKDKIEDGCDVPLEEDTISISNKIDDYKDISKKRRFTDLSYLNKFQEKILENKPPENINIAHKYELSLCLEEMIRDPKNFEAIFNSKKIDFEAFKNEYESLINNSNLAIRIDNQIYPFKAGKYVLMTKVLYNKNPDQEDIEKYLISSQSGIFGSLKSKIKLPVFEYKETKELKFKPRHSNLESLKTFTLNREIKEKSNDKRGNVPSSLQLNRMNLKPGKNTITFKCHSRITGTQTLSCDIHLWDYKDKIIISDVDGTITKSDVMGHIMPILGKDWTHEGVAKLFNLITNNGYKIIYLTARALCQVKMTKKYLKGIKQGECHNYKFCRRTTFT